MLKSSVKCVLRQVLRSASLRNWLRHELASSPQLKFAPPGHFYSPLPDPADIERNTDRFYAPSKDDAVNLNAASQRQLLRQLAAYRSEFDWPDQATNGKRFWLKNGFFGHGDAVVLYALLRYLKPSRIVEVGSGFSSALILDTNDRYFNSSLDLTFIDPYPARLQALLTESDRQRTRLIASPVQDVPLDVFLSLSTNDILFIDSSHVSKIGSDVNHLIFSVLPRLKDGVVVHFHDVFYPFEYPLEWLREGRSWNEAYLLRAFLQYNSAFEIILFNSFLWQHDSDFVQSQMPLIGLNPGGSLWLRKTGSPVVSGQSPRHGAESGIGPI
jgi:predicted O-methyltransferase YrrM